MGKIRASQLKDIEIVDATELADTGTPSGADQVGLRDSGGYYTNSNVEDAMQEVPDLAALSSTNFVEAVAGEDLSAGDWVFVYTLGSSNEVRKAKADSSSTLPTIGVATASANASDPVVVQVGGVNDDQSGLTVGSKYFVSAAVAGGITSTASITPSQFVQYVGVALSATQIVMQISISRKRA